MYLSRYNLLKVTPAFQDILYPHNSSLKRTRLWLCHNLVRYPRKDLREGDDLSGLKAFGTLLDGEFHFLFRLEPFVALHVD
jgi:hypothetical protein